MTDTYDAEDNARSRGRRMNSTSMRSIVREFDNERASTKKAAP